jgi:hypothetical protein
MTLKQNHPIISDVFVLLKTRLHGIIDVSDLSCRKEFHKISDEYVFGIYRSYELFYEHRVHKSRFSHCRTNEEINTVKSQIVKEMADGVILSLL